MQKARRHTVVLRPLVSVWFQVLFTLLLAVLFTFPSRYLFAIGLLGVFSLTRWFWQIHTEFHMFRATQDTNTINILTCTGLSPSAMQLSNYFQFKYFLDIMVLQPHQCRNIDGLGSFQFVRHYYGNHYYFLFLQVLRCFSSLGLLSFE